MGFTLLFDKNLVLKESPDSGLEALQKDFWTKRKAELNEINTALEQNDYEIVLKLSHNWKGFSQPYGFQTLGQLAKELEEAAKNKDLSQCQLLASNIERYLQLKKELLEIESE